MAVLTDEERNFLDRNPFLATVTTLRADGSPHATIVWIDVEDGKISFNTARGRAKAKHLEHDPRASILVVDPKDPYRYVAVDGHARLTEDGADAQMDKLAKKYLGEDRYPWRDPADTRVKVLIEPEHVTASGFDG
jgi:PPOX class probable F420-dependent enzyme